MRKRLVAIVRLRESALAESVAETQAPQLVRGQDDDKPPKPKKPKPKVKAKAKRRKRGSELRFRAYLREAAVSRAGGRSYEVSLLREGPGNQNDRRWYSREALRKAVSDGLFEGAQCYADHPTASEERERPERSVRTLIGHFREARLVDGSPAEVRAKFLPVTGSGYEWVTSLIESALGSPPGKPLVGLSIDGYGTADGEKQHEGKRYEVIREIAKLGSVDLVTRAGAGGQFHRRLSESLAGARASAGGHELSAAKLQKQVSKALRQLERGLADENDGKVREAFVALHEAAGATVKPATQETAELGAEVGRLREAEAALDAKLAKQRKRRKLAETRAADATRLAESTAATLERLQESAGIGRVEGAGRRDLPSVPAAPPGGGLLTRMGIDPDELEAA